MAAEGQAVVAGARVRGPSALGDDLVRFVRLTGILALTDFKLRFYGSALGYVWQLAQPLAMFGVLYVVFTQFVRLGGGVKFYPVILLAGVMLYRFLAEATNASVTSLVDREPLVRKIQFARLVVPAAAVTTAVLHLALNLVALFVFVAVAGVEPSVSWLLFPVVLVALVALASGISMLVSALYVRYRDVRPIWEVLVQMLFYGSPIFWPIEIVPSVTAQKLIIMLNPFATVLQQTRHSLIDPGAPSAADAAGGAVWLLVPLGIVAALLALGFWIFSREAPRVAEEL